MRAITIYFQEKNEKINYFSQRYKLCERESIRKLNAAIIENKRVGRYSVYSVIDITLFKFGYML